jgi:hypothetical protein
VGHPFWRDEIALAAAGTLYTDWGRTGLDALTVFLPRRGRNPSNELVPSRGDGPSRHGRNTPSAAPSKRPQLGQIQRN